jgi:hypothetical protein
MAFSSDEETEIHQLPEAAFRNFLVNNVPHATFRRETLNQKVRFPTFMELT